MLFHGYTYGGATDGQYFLRFGSGLGGAFIPVEGLDVHMVLQHYMDGGVKQYCFERIKNSELETLQDSIAQFVC